MSYLAALLVEAKSIKPVVAAVRAAYKAIGAIEGEGTRVVIGAPIKGWCAITEGTHHTVDLGVAIDLARTLKTRVVATGQRGSSNYGKGAMKAFGPWATKVKTSGKGKIVGDLVTALKTKLPEQWLLEHRDGVTLTFDLTTATRTPGPFKSNTQAELIEAEQGAQTEVAHDLAGSALNGMWAEADEALAGLRGAWGWQEGFDRVNDVLQTNSLELTAESARLVVALAKGAFEAAEPKIPERWNETEDPWMIAHRWGNALLCCLVANDLVVWEHLIDQVPVKSRQRIAIQVWTKSPVAIAGLAKKARAALERDLPVAHVLAWAKKTPIPAKGSWHGEAAQLAARFADKGVLDRLFATKQKTELQRINYEAYKLMRAKEFEAALVLFDRLIDRSFDDSSVFTNALYAVQSDNNGRKLDRGRALRYIAAATPHAEANPPIYVNVAAVQLELGDREAMFVALEAAKRHKEKHLLAELRGQKLFAPLAKDPRFVAIVGKPR